MVLKEVLDNLTKEIEKISEVKKIVESARELFDNRLGWGTQQNPYAPRELWAELGASLYGDNDERVKELRLDPFKGPSEETYKDSTTLKDNFKTDHKLCNECKHFRSDKCKICKNKNIVEVTIPPERFAPKH